MDLRRRLISLRQELCEVALACRLSQCPAEQVITLTQRKGYLIRQVLEAQTSSPLF
jgi:hypothetical protein